MRYTITPDAPGHPETSFKVFNRDGIKVATLAKEQVIDALGEHQSAELEEAKDLLRKLKHGTLKDSEWPAIDQLIGGTEEEQKENE